MDYTVKQTVTLNGEKVTSTMVVPNVDAAELATFLALLEGGYEVVEVNEALSDNSGAETNVSATNAVDYISMRGAQNQSAFISGFNSKAIHFKNTVSGDDIRNVLKVITPFPLLPTEKPSKIAIKATETVL